MLIERGIRPDCRAGDAVPVFTVVSRAAGAEHADGFRPANVAEFRDAVDAYCSLGPEVQVAGSTQHPDGSFTVTLQILNPTGDRVEVVSEEFRTRDSTWEAAATTVPPGGETELVIHGEGNGCSVTNPWTTGHVTLDGVAPEMEEWASEQC